MQARGQCMRWIVNKIWQDEAWEDFKYWTKQDKKTLKRILQLLQDIDRNGYEGIGKPEPLSSPKAKHKKMPNNIDFLKISNGKYGVINFNNMVPVPEKEILEIDYTAIKDKEYLSLLENQIRWSLLNSSKIKKHAEKLRERSMKNKLPNRIRNRCCDFRLLEKQLEKYLEKDKQKEIDIEL